VAYLAENGKLKFFILENVKGLFRKRKHEEQSLGDMLLGLIRSKLPKWASRFTTLFCGCIQCEMMSFNMVNMRFEVERLGCNLILLTHPVVR
jgi:hypothetical protein